MAVGRAGEAAPGVRVLLDWLEHRLGDDQADEVALAVADGDEELRTTVVWLRDFLASTDRHRLEPAPAVIGHTLRQHFRTWSAGADLPHPRLPDLVPADLVFDSRRDAPRAAVRSGGTSGAAFQLAYTCAAGDVVLDLFPGAHERLRIDGQVLLSSAAGGRFHAELIGPDGRVRSPEGDDHGRFSVTEAPAAQARLLLRSADVAITLDVDLRGKP